MTQRTRTSRNASCGRRGIRNGHAWLLVSLPSLPVLLVLSVPMQTNLPYLWGNWNGALSALVAVSPGSATFTTSGTDAIREREGGCP